MNKQQIHAVTKYLFCLGMAGAAVSELIWSEVVVASLEAISVPLRLLYLLGVCKLAGVATLLFSTNRRLTEWAYAGFFFNLIGAIYVLFSAGETILPDMIVAPVYLLLWGLAFFTNSSVSSPAKPTHAVSGSLNRPL